MAQPPPSPDTEPLWHALDADEVLRRLGSGERGLSEKEAAQRLRRFGPNALPEPAQPSLANIVARQLANPLSFILFLAASCSLALGRAADAAFIGLVVLIDAGIGTLQERRAERSAAALRNAVASQAVVVRDGVRKTVAREALVPGDIVLLEGGAAAPADLRLTRADDLRVDESLLTGESRPERKSVEPLSDADAPIGDRTSMAYAGSLAMHGGGAGVVVATGARTEIGRIASLLRNPGAKPPLVLRMEAFSRRLAVVVVVCAALIGAGQLFRGSSVIDVFLMTTALVVSAIPEGLPMAITVCLAVASTRMAQRHVIVRRLPAVEALGSCTLIATDKTGTLTANRLTVRRLVLADGAVFEVSGEGLELEGGVAPAPEGPAEAAIRRLSSVAALASEAAIVEQDGVVEPSGDAVDVAFLVLARKLAVTPQAGVDARIPYEPSRAFAAAFADENGRRRVFVKGAPEVLLPMCANHHGGAAAAARLAAEGYRVIAIAEGVAHDDACDGTALRDLALLGFAGLVDPVRSEAPAAVAAARAAGLDVRMITGDHPDTALSIAAAIDPGWARGPVLTGREMRALDPDARAAAVEAATIYARVDPAQKTEIVEALQRGGHFVAVTGDGVNDAPALKAAHVGVAMGAGGADVAREASDLILTDDNFASIVAGVEEGRTAYANIRKIIWLLVSTALAEIAIFALALAFGLPAPLTAVQILWLNLVTEGVQDVALAFEGREPDAMRRPPRPTNEPLFDRTMLTQCVIVGMWAGPVAFAVFQTSYAASGDVDAARNLTLLFLVWFNNFHTLNCRSERRSLFSMPFASNRSVAASVAGAQALHLIAMHTPVVSSVLGLSPVSPTAWLEAMALGGGVVLIVEVYKLLRRRRDHITLTKAA